MYEVAVKSSFSAAHRLRDYQGKCENLHGHNWNVEAAVSSKTLDKRGLLIDFKILKKTLGGILDELDHTYLNELAFFKKENPTSENIAKFIFDALKESGIRAGSVSVRENETSRATYYADR